MKRTKMIETTITVELSAQDIIEWIKAKQFIPSDWKYYSVEVVGSGISKGANLVIKEIRHEPFVK